MVIDILSYPEKYRTIIEQKIESQRLKGFGEMFNHAIMMKSDVHYDENSRIANIKIFIHDSNSKAKVRIFGITLWRNAIRPAKPCILFIRDIKQFIIQDNDPPDPQRQEVLIGPIIISGTDIFIGSFCEKENNYCIQIKTEKINMTLKCEET